MHLTIDLWKHQREMVNFAKSKYKEGMGVTPLNHPPVTYAWWLAGCRTGKTLSVYALISEMSFQRSLIITKKATIDGAWLQDANQFVEDANILYLGEKPHGTGIAPKRMNAKAKASLTHDFVTSRKNAIVVVNYTSAKLIADTLESLNFDFVCLDESHMIKSHNSGVSVKLAKALGNVPNKLIMTGTGWDDRPTDVYGQVRFLANNGRGRYPRSSHFGTWSQFFELYVDYYMMNNIKIPKGYKNLEGIYNTINPFIMRVDTEDVLDLPPIRHIDMLLDMPAKMKTAYRDLEELLVAEMSEEDLLIADNRLTLGLRLHQLTGGYYPDEDGNIVEYVADKDNPKLNALLDIVDEIDGQPLVVFTRFRHDVTLIKRALEKRDITVAQLTGAVQEHVSWQRNADKQVLIANISAGGTGVTLSRARYVVYYSIGHSRTDYSQSLWRVRDANSDKNKPIVYHHLLMRNSVDEDIRRGLQAKGEISDYLLSNLTNRLTDIK